jgi:hypothetical protein
MCADVKSKATIVTVTSYATSVTENIDLFPNIDVFSTFFMHGVKHLRIGTPCLATRPSILSVLKNF